MNEDRASRYHRLKRQAGIIGLLWAALLLAGVLATGASLWLRDTAETAAGALPASWQPGAVILAYVALLSMLNELGSLPLAFYSGYILERRYDLSNETLGAWLRDQAKSFGIGLLLAGPAATLVYWLIRVSPDRWWLAAGFAFAVLIVGLTNLAPVLLLPLFYTVKPLARDGLRLRLIALAERAGAQVLGAYEWGLANKTKKANAALAGVGNTRRILVSDTMLAEYSDEEIEVVLAHELAHHVHGDIWKGVVFESVLILAGFYLASRLLSVLVGPLACAASPIPRACRCCCSPRAACRWRWCRSPTPCRAASRGAPIATPSISPATRRRSSPRCAASAPRIWPRTSRRRSCSGSSTVTPRSRNASRPRKASRADRPPVIVAQSAPPSCWLTWP